MKHHSRVPYVNKYTHRFWTLLPGIVIHTSQPELKPKSRWITQFYSLLWIHIHSHGWVIEETFYLQTIKDRTAKIFKSSHKPLQEVAVPLRSNYIPISLYSRGVRDHRQTNVRDHRQTKKTKKQTNKQKNKTKQTNKNKTRKYIVKIWANMGWK